MARLKLTTFTVRATQEQAERWHAAAQYEGARHVGAWLAILAADRMRQLGRWVPRMAIRWRRARFRVLLRPEMGGELAPQEVSGLVGGPFGIYKSGAGSWGWFTLVHTPTGCTLITLPKLGRTKSLARQLATFKINWNATVPGEVKGPDTSRLSVELSTARRAADPNKYEHA